MLDGLFCSGFERVVFFLQVGQVGEEVGFLRAEAFPRLVCGLLAAAGGVLGGLAQGGEAEVGESAVTGGWVGGWE